MRVESGVCERHASGAFDLSFVISLLNLYGIEYFNDTRYFTKGNLKTLNTIEEFRQSGHELALEADEDGF